MKAQPIAKYSANNRYKESIFATWALMLKNIVASRELIWQLFRRDFLASYRKSFLGLGWLVITPIIGVVSWVFMNAAGILSPGGVDIPYPAYVLLSSSVWGLFMGFYTASSNTLVAGAGFISQVNYPHEVMLVKENLQYLANFLIVMAVNLVVLAIFKVSPSLAGLLLFPLVSLPMFFLGGALGLVSSLVTIVSPDISNFMNKAINLVFFITPVVYSADKAQGLLRTVVEYNPLTYLIAASRDIIIYGHINNIEAYLLTSIVSFLLFLLSLRLFYVAELKIIERMV
jgi:lipopolysaccharide transport system permease protein